MKNRNNTSLILDLLTNSGCTTLLVKRNNLSSSELADISHVSSKHFSWDVSCIPEQYYFMCKLFIFGYKLSLRAWLCRDEETRNFTCFLFSAPASSSWHMDDFIKVVKQVEDEHPGSEPVAVLKRLRRAAGLNDAFIQHFLGDAGSGGPEMDAGLSVYIRKAVHHRVTEDAKEEGVVLTSDGTTVALMPLLLGIEAGFLSKSSRPVRGLYQLTLAKDLDLSFRRSSPPTQLLGPDGCWDNVTSPQVFTLLDSPSLLTTARLNGGMDGVVLGMEAKSRRPLKLSSLLMDYYCHQLDSNGLDAAPRLISQRRRENFKGLVSPPVLTRQVVKSVELQRRLTGHSKMDMKKKRQLTAVVKEGMRDFVHKYMGEHETKSQRK